MDDASNEPADGFARPRCECCGGFLYDPHSISVGCCWGCRLVLLANDVGYPPQPEPTVPPPSGNP